VAPDMDDGVLDQKLNCALGLACLQILTSSNEYCVGTVQVRVCRARRPLSSFTAECLNMSSVDRRTATP